MRRQRRNGADEDLRELERELAEGEDERAAIKFVAIAARRDMLLDPRVTAVMKKVARWTYWSAPLKAYSEAFLSRGQWRPHWLWARFGGGRNWGGWRSRHDPYVTERLLEWASQKRLLVPYRPDLFKPVVGEPVASEEQIGGLVRHYALIDALKGAKPSPEHLVYATLVSTGYGNEDLVYDSNHRVFEASYSGLVFHEGQMIYVWLGVGLDLDLELRRVSDPEFVKSEGLSPWLPDEARTAAFTVSGSEDDEGREERYAAIESMVSDLERLENYPILDEDDLSQLQRDDEERQWGDWGRRDFLRALEEAYGLQDLDDAENQDVDSLWWRLQEDTGHYTETGSDISFPFDRVVETMQRPHGWARVEGVVEHGVFEPWSAQDVLAALGLEAEGHVVETRENGPRRRRRS